MVRAALQCRPLGLEGIGLRGGHRPGRGGGAGPVVGAIEGDVAVGWLEADVSLGDSGHRRLAKGAMGVKLWDRGALLGSRGQERRWGRLLRLGGRAENIGHHLGGGNANDRHTGLAVGKAVGQRVGRG